MYFKVSAVMGSFYGISAAALNHLIKVLHYILSLMSPTLPQNSSFLATFSTLLDLLGAQSGGSASDTIFGANNSSYSNLNFDLNYLHTYAFLKSFCLTSL